MPALILRNDERLETVECPTERSLEIVATEHGAELVDYRNSLSEARWRIQSSPSFKADWI
jgi:hypothetical protein